jgi:hypothetical protein
MFEKINFIYFTISFCVGIFLVYIQTPKKTIVYKFPSPDNSDLVYKDKSESCYKYHSNEIECPKDDSAIEPQPIIEDFETVPPHTMEDFVNLNIKSKTQQENRRLKNI